MNRLKWIKKSGVFIASAIISPVFVGAKVLQSKPALTIAHITDIQHIRKGDTAPVRFRKRLVEVRKHIVGFFLDGGDSTYAAGYAVLKLYAGGRVTIPIFLR